MKTVERKRIATINGGILELYCRVRPVIKGRKYLTTVVDSSYHQKYKTLRIKTYKEMISKEEFEEIINSGKLAFRKAILSIATVEVQKSTMWGESVLSYQVPELLLLGISPFCQNITGKRLILTKLDEKSTAYTSRRCFIEANVLLDWKLLSTTGTHWERIILAEDYIKMECRRKTCRGNTYMEVKTL